MRRLTFLVAALIASVAVFTQVGAARADDWCFIDPLVKIDNNIVDMSVALQGTHASIKSAVNSATYTVHVAPGTQTRVLFSYGPDFPQNVQWVYDGTRNADGSQNVKVDVSFTMKPNKGALPVAFLVYRLTNTGGKYAITGQTLIGTTAAPIATSFTLP
jgi:hypothetical protein